MADSGLWMDRCNNMERGNTLQYACVTNTRSGDSKEAKSKMPLCKLSNSPFVLSPIASRCPDLALTNVWITALPAWCYAQSIPVAATIPLRPLLLGLAPLRTCLGRACVVSHDGFFRAADWLQSSVSSSTSNLVCIGSSHAVQIGPDRLLELLRQSM